MPLKEELIKRINAIKEEIDKLEKSIEDSPMDNRKKSAALEYLREADIQLFMLETTLED